MKMLFPIKILRESAECAALPWQDSLIVRQHYYVL
jgi:hypothetical protein